MPQLKHTTLIFCCRLGVLGTLVHAKGGKGRPKSHPYGGHFCILSIVLTVVVVVAADAVVVLAAAVAVVVVVVVV